MVADMKPFVAVYAFGLWCLVAYALIMAGTFYTAYFEDDRCIQVCTNKFGEADLEFVLIAVTLPLGLFSLIKITWSRREKHETEDT